MSEGTLKTRTMRFSAGISAGRVSGAGALTGGGPGERKGSFSSRPGTRQVPSWVSAVGAGDSFVAGFVLAMARDWPVADALALGAAAASAAVMTPATDLCHAQDVDRFYQQRVVTRL